MKRIRWMNTKYLYFRQKLFIFQLHLTTYAALILKKICDEKCDVRNRDQVSKYVVLLFL